MVPLEQRGWNRVATGESRLKPRGGPADRSSTRGGCKWKEGLRGGTIQRKVLESRLSCGDHISMSKKILVTGAAGFIGSYIVDLLLGEGREVIGIDNFVLGRRENLSEAFKNDRFELLDVDLAELAAVKIHRADLIFSFQ